MVDTSSSTVSLSSALPHFGFPLIDLISKPPREASKEKEKRRIEINQLECECAGKTSQIGREVRGDWLAG